MPCWTKQEVKVQLNVAEPRTLRGGLKAAGLSVNGEESFTFAGTLEGEYVSGSFRNGVLRFSDAPNNQTAVTNAMKRAYSGEIVKRAGARFKWNVKSTKAGKFQVTRRY